MGWSSRATTHKGTTRVCLLLATDSGCCGDLCQDLSCVPTRQSGPTSAQGIARATMDSIIGLPKSEGYGSIIVVVDRFSKYATFIAALKDCTAEETVMLFLKNVVKYWGLPKFIISDRDSRFTGKFLMELFKLMGTELHFSTSFHPQTDGQTERVNALLELYLRHFVSANKTD